MSFLAIINYDEVCPLIKATTQDFAMLRTNSTLILSHYDI